MVLPINLSHCDVCHFSKQNKLPFSLSYNFDFIHVDIRGPITTPSVHSLKYFVTIILLQI